MPFWDLQWARPVVCAGVGLAVALLGVGLLFPEAARSHGFPVAAGFSPFLYALRKRKYLRRHYHLMPLLLLEFPEYPGGADEFAGALGVLLTAVGLWTLSGRFSGALVLAWIGTATHTLHQYVVIDKELRMADKERAEAAALVSMLETLAAMPLLWHAALWSLPSSSEVVEGPGGAGGGGGGGGGDGGDDGGGGDCGGGGDGDQEADDDQADDDQDDQDKHNYCGDDVPH